MQGNTDEAARREAAAANLAKRKKAIRKRKRRRLKLFIVSGLILSLLLAFVAVKTAVSRREAIESASEAEEIPAENANIVMGLKGSAVQKVLQGDPYIENGAFAIDSRTGAIGESNIKIKGDVDTSEPGDYTVKYSVKNEGISAEIERTVRVLSDEDFGDKASNVPVMMYHWVYTEDDVPEELDGNWILDTTLDEQLSFLDENNFYYPGWKELRAWIDGTISLPATVTVLTFDDGKEAFLKYGIPVLEKHKIPATSFMICWENNHGAERVKKYASPYIDFESHSYEMHQKVEVKDHKGIMATMSKEEISADLAKAAEITGNNDAFAYPYGDYTDDMIEAVRDQGILCAFTVEYERVRVGMDPMKLPRIRVLGDESFQIWKESVY